MQKKNQEGRPLACSTYFVAWHCLQNGDVPLCPPFARWSLSARYSGGHRGRAGRVTEVTGQTWLQRLSLWCTRTTATSSGDMIFCVAPWSWTHTVRLSLFISGFPLVPNHTRLAKQLGVDRGKALAQYPPQNYNAFIFQKSGTEIFD